MLRSARSSSFPSPRDPKVYDLPLTAPTTVPAQWTAARVKQQGEAKQVAVLKNAEGSYVQYNVVPNAGAVRIERGQ